MARGMKDSGIKIIGMIPQSWTLRRIKNLANVYTGNSIKDEQKELYEDPSEAIPYIATKDIDAKMQTIDYENGMYVKKADESFRRAPVQSTLLCIEGGSAGKKIAFTEKTVCFVNKLCCFHSSFDSNKYLYYYLMSPAFTQLFNSHISGLIGGVSVKEISSFVITCPPLEEQERIALFLDSECKHIDAVIEQTCTSIEEYKKLKQSIITQAVTKGIHPDRQMKESGIEWIGLIPADWNICKLRHIGTTQNGISKGGGYFGEGYPFVSYSDVYHNLSLPREVNGLVRTTEEEQRLYSVKRGDIFFTRTSETIEEVGFSSVCEETIPKATFAGFLIRVRPYDDTLDVGYSKYYFRSNHHRFYLVKQMNLVTRASLGQSLLKGMPVLIPSKREQIEIANYLDEKCVELDKLILSKERIISELESYKKSLIYEYVTGKKEVPV